MSSPTSHEPPWRLFLRFLRFGLLAWGGPVAQIAMIRQELVEEQRWITRERFNRVLAVYQVLPGPEAHELCVYFGMLKGGRLGGLLAGLGFMLPGFALMFALSWWYVRVGMASPAWAAAFAGAQVAVIALIVRAIHRIGRHALTDRWLWAIAALALAAQGLGVHFLPTLLAAGGCAAAARRRPRLAIVLMLGWLAGALGWRLLGDDPTPIAEALARMSPPSAWRLLGAGLRTGLLTFGGAYTAIPFLRHDAVTAGGWMTDAQFLDGLALSGILPAPLIIFSTFVGYLGGGPLGALALAAGVFVPAFAFTLIGHELMERLIHTPALHRFLDGVTAGVVGLIAATAVGLVRGGLTSVPAAILFAAALAALYRWTAKATAAGVVLGAGILGALLFR
jgi:chromate transporter